MLLPFKITYIDETAVVVAPSKEQALKLYYALGGVADGVSLPQVKALRPVPQVLKVWQE
jgi:hypothetical protein